MAAAVPQFSPNDPRFKRDLLAVEVAVGKRTAAKVKARSEAIRLSEEGKPALLGIPDPDAITLTAHELDVARRLLKQIPDEKDLSGAVKSPDRRNDLRILRRALQAVTDGPENAADPQLLGETAVEREGAVAELSRAARGVVRGFKLQIHDVLMELQAPDIHGGRPVDPGLQTGRSSGGTTPQPSSAFRPVFLAP